MAGRPRRDPVERFCERVDMTGDCWLWEGSLTWGGYGKFSPGGRTTIAVHRWVYATFVEPIPDGLHIDHLCSVRHCVNPDHLEPVTQRENTLRSANFIAENARKTHCKHGHEFTEANTYIHPQRGTRDCRVCRDVVASKRKIHMSNAS